jgi:hypothetical protein
MKYQFDRSFTFKFNEDKWEAYLITHEEAFELDEKVNDMDEGFRAITLMDENCLFIVEGSVTRNIVAHELVHIVTKYFYLNSADITVIQYEEIMAEYMEENLDKFIKKRNYLFKKFKQLEGS